MFQKIAKVESAVISALKIPGTRRDLETRISGLTTSEFDLIGSAILLLLNDDRLVLSDDAVLSIGGAW